MAINEEAAPIVKPLSIGSTERNEISAFAVLAVDETTAPNNTTNKYRNRLLQLSISRLQYPLVMNEPAESHEQSENVLLKLSYVVQPA